MYAKAILPALAGLSFVAAASSAAPSSTDPCSVATVTISAAADATSLASCSTISGSVVITNTAGNVIALEGPKAIKGGLDVENNGALITLSSSTIGSIGGAFTLNNLTILSTLQFTALQTVGSIAWTALPALGSLTFGTPGVTSAKSLVVSDTFLDSLNGINLQTASTFDVNNNVKMTTLSTQIANISDVLNVQANGQNLAVEFPNLNWAANITLSNCSSVSVPSLVAVNGSLGLRSNYFENFNAPNLTKVGGTISFAGNPDVTNVSLPLLTTVGGGVVVANNTDFLAISFQDLKTVGGAIEFYGDFTNFSIPSLSNVAGGVNIQSTADITDQCTTYQAFKKNGTIQGTYTCKTSANATSMSGSGTTSGTGTSSSSSPTSSKSSAAMPLYGANVPAVVGVSLLGGLAQMLF